MDGQVLLYSQNQMKTLLSNAAENVNKWLCQVRKMKAVYHQLNMFDLNVQRSCYVGEFWVPTKYHDHVVACIERSAVRPYCSLLTPPIKQPVFGTSLVPRPVFPQQINLPLI